MLLLEKIKELDTKEKEIKEMPEIIELNKRIKELNEKLNEIEKPYNEAINSLDDEIVDFIVNRVKLLNSSGYSTKVSGKNGLDEYYIDGNKLVISEYFYSWSENIYYQDEIPLYLFTSSDEEVLSLIKEKKEKEEKAKLAKEKEELMRKLEELRKYEKETGMTIKEVYSR